MIPNHEARGSSVPQFSELIQFGPSVASYNAIKEGMSGCGTAVGVGVGGVGVAVAVGGIGVGVRVGRTGVDVCVGGAGVEVVVSMGVGV